MFEARGWKSEVATLYNVRGVPAHYLIDREGRIAAREIPKNNLEKEIARLLE